MRMRLILGDQLDLNHSWFSFVDPDVLYVMMEVRPETEYVHHHAQKLLAVFGAMRNFAAELEGGGHRLRYLKIGDFGNRQSFEENLSSLAAEYGAQLIEYQRPDEYRLEKLFLKLEGALPLRRVESEHFLLSREEAAAWFGARKNPVMEYFYRDIRKKTGWLMEEDAPRGGKWNYDEENRRAWRGDPPVPARNRRMTDLRPLWEEIQAAGISSFGDPRAEAFCWPLSREEALDDLARFRREGLPSFGRYQDAMATGEPFLFHSLLSFALNVKLISPREVIEAVLAAADENPAIPLASLEGFIRQIAGWREYMRGIYWERMPGFSEENFFGHERVLPSWYWTGEVKMRCLRQSIGQSLKEAYAHHIQRLMITGNFALLAGIDPQQVDDWYLGVYIDAFQWVELPNTRGMSQFADGGKTATKPYAGSANYISRMSDYCKECRYDQKQRHGDGACPFNSLYWDYYLRHRARLEENPRIGFVYRTLDRFSEEERKSIRRRAEKYLKGIEEL